MLLWRQLAYRAFIGPVSGADSVYRRRTKQSGPLGELFDHGVDALNTSLEVLIFAASQNMGQGWKTVATLFACTLCRIMLVAPHLDC